MNLSAYHNYPVAASPYIDGQCSTTINPVYNKFGQQTAMGGGSEFDARNFQDFVHDARYAQFDADGAEDDAEAIAEYSKSPAYATQSLDRRKSRDGKLAYSHSFKDEVVLRPISGRPFDYLQRPGSTADLNGGPTGMHYRLYGSRTLPRDFENRSSTQSIRDVAL